MGGGPSKTQEAASAQQLANAKNEGKLANQSAEKFNSIYGEVHPFFTEEQNFGLPFYNDLTDFNSGTTARAYAPIKGAFRRMTSTLQGAPSGFRTSGLLDIDEARAKAFDDQLRTAALQNFMTRQQGAAGNAGLMQIVNPAAFYGGSSSASSSAMQPLQAAPNPWMSVLGGAVSGATSVLPV